MRRLTSKQIIRNIEQNKENIQKYGVKRIGLFGSFLHNMPNARSDIDFLVTLKEHKFDAYMDLKFMLEEMFKRKVDVVLESSLKPAMKYVKKEALYAKI